MHLKTQNINTGFRDLVEIFKDGGKISAGEYETRVVSEPSRNGNVLRIAEPVIITYTRPTERVLFNTARDVNPFSLIYEAMWMLAGRNDVASLAYYTKRFREFSDDGETLNGAYGYRWRGTGRFDAYGRGTADQLDLLVSHLKAQPNSRRAVLQMWNVEDDLLKIGGLRTNSQESWRANDYGSKDTCCNLSVLFSLRKKERTDEPEYYLDMTVTNRSNDLIWGALGANYVTFTILQEYMAARLGAEVGVYNQFSNNLHCYCDRDDWNPQAFLSDQSYSYTPQTNIVPLVKDPEAFERELPILVEQYSGNSSESSQIYTEPFLKNVAQPMFEAWRSRKQGGSTTLLHLERISATDWKVAAQGWVNRRADRAKGRV